MEPTKKAKTSTQPLGSSVEEEDELASSQMSYSDSSSDEDGENAPKLQERQREAAVARMQRFFGLDMDDKPEEPIVQDDSNFVRKMYWSCIQDSGFPHRVNHAVAAHRSVQWTERVSWALYSALGNLMLSGHTHS